MSLRHHPPDLAIKALLPELFAAWGELLLSMLHCDIDLAMLSPALDIDAMSTVNKFIIVVVLSSINAIE
jgi:hypothetical protein